jgi:hypothetical protein
MNPPGNFTVAVDIGSSDFRVAYYVTDDDGTQITVLTAAGRGDNRTALLYQEQQPLASGNTAVELHQLLSCVLDGIPYYGPGGVRAGLQTRAGEAEGGAGGGYWCRTSGPGWYRWREALCGLFEACEEVSIGSADCTHSSLQLPWLNTAAMAYSCHGLMNWLGLLAGWQL